MAIPLSQQILLVGLFLLQAGRHLRRVEPLAVRTHEFGIIQAFRDHYVGHGAHHGRVGPRPDRDPFVRQADRAHAQARVDAHHPGSILARFLDKEIAVGAIPHLGRVPTPHQDIAGVQPILALVAGLQRAINSRGRQVGRPPGIAVINPQAAAEQVQQAAGGLRTIELVITTGTIGDEQGTVAILLAHAQQLLGQQIQGLIPGNALETAFAAPADPLERMLQPVRMVLAPQVGPAARTGAQLGRREQIRPVIGIQPGDPPILNVGLQQAAAAAIVRRTPHPDHPFQCLFAS